MSKFGDLIRGINAPAPKVEVAPAPEPVVEEAPVVEKTSSLEEMDKVELEAYGRKHGVELDRRHSKKKLIEELREIGE
jgi:hypothetical protein